MKITVQSTTRMVEANGIPCRVWEGKTERGIKISCLIPRIAVASGDDTSQFEAELTEKPLIASNMPEAFPLKMII
jgi:hypothetical protein